VDALCFTVEIDKRQFPDAADFINRLEENNVLYMSNELNIANHEKDCVCYRFEFDDYSLRCVSKVLADIVKFNHLYSFANSIIESNYTGIGENGKKSIISSVLKFADIEEIISLIYDFIFINKHIHLGGFVLFRMKDFLKSFEDEIDFAVDEFIEQQRYRDFVRFLKFFVDIQDCSFEKINLLIHKNGNYLLLDDKGVPISKELLDSTHCEISALENCDSYLVINDLISLAPKNITIHCRIDAETEEPIKIIKEIFSHKVNICHCCSICSRQV